jgi:hypothetical protein
MRAILRLRHVPMGSRYFIMAALTSFGTHPVGIMCAVQLFQCDWSY